MQKIIFSSLLIAGFNTPLQAETTTNDATLALPDKVVTATRTEMDPGELASGSTVYTRQDIERLQVKTLPDLFKGAIGVDLAQSGGYGQVTDLFLRGTNPDHVLVLIDGIKAGSVTAGTTPFELIPIDQIERVEIIRGPQSSLYGSEAIGGVIQIFTRKGSQNDDKPHFTMEAGGGSYDTAHTAGTVSGKFDNSWYNLGVSHLNSQGFSNKQNSDPDRDGYVNTGINARAGHRFTNNAELEAFFMRAEGTTEYDSDFGGDNSEFVNQVVGVSGNMDVMDNWHTTLRLGQSLDDLDTFLPDGTFESRFNSTRWNASWLNELQLSDAHQLILGTDYRLDEVDSGDLDAFNSTFDTYNENSRYDVGVFTELHSRLFDNHFINASLRWDENEAFGDYVTGNIGWRYNSEYGISPFASFGNAFKAPTFNELYWPDTGFGGGNPDLKPEESQSFEVGLAGNHRYAKWELRAYHTDVEQLISGWPPVNVDNARIEGLEAEISTDLLGWHQKLNMSLLEPIDLKTGLRLQRRTDKTLSFDLSRSIGQFDLGANVLAQGNRPDLDFNTFPSTRVTLDGYVTVDLRTAWHVNKNWMLSAKLNNLLDENYQTANTYNTPGRNFFVSIHYNN
ncbi:MAG: TonB-dependent receptor domain-containing protein [Methylovulum sp.]